MNITLYKNTSPSNVVNKTITQLSSGTCTLKEKTSIVNPVFLLADIGTHYSDCNYIYVPELNRYYYVLDVIAVRNGVWELHCHVDVLMTYRNEIRSQTCIVERQENISNMYLSDPRLKVQANPYVQQISFPNGFESAWTYCLAVVGN